MLLLVLLFCNSSENFTISRSSLYFCLVFVLFWGKFDANSRRRGTCYTELIAAAIPISKYLFEGSTCSRFDILRTYASLHIYFAWQFRWDIQIFSLDCSIPHFCQRFPAISHSTYHDTFWIIRNIHRAEILCMPYGKSPINC